MTSYVKNCDFCGVIIRMAEDHKGDWQPWEMDSSGRHNCGQSTYSHSRTIISSGFSRSYTGSLEDFCRPATCPVCYEPVFFIRHNGGCLWVDSLGHPWPKHACMDEDQTKIYEVFVSQADDVRSPLLGIIISTENIPRSKFIEFTIRCEDTRTCFAKYSLDGNTFDDPTTWHGSLVIISEKEYKVKFPDEVVRIARGLSFTRIPGRSLWE